MNATFSEWQEAARNNFSLTVTLLATLSRHHLMSWWQYAAVKQVADEKDWNNQDREETCKKHLAQAVGERHAAT